MKLRRKYPDLAGFANRDVRLFEDGLKVISRSTLKGDWRFVSTIAAVQASNAISAAWDLLFLGYDTEPLALARLSGEYSLLMHYLDTHPDEAERWFDTDKPTPMTAGEMARRLEREGVATFPQSFRDELHRFSHQDTMAMSMSVKVKGPNTLEIGRIGQHVREVATILLIQDAHLLIRLHESGAREDSKWEDAMSRELGRIVEVTSGESHSQ
jgi:hypothetical protein